MTPSNTLILPSDAPSRLARRKGGGGKGGGKSSSSKGGSSGSFGKSTSSSTHTSSSKTISTPHLLGGQASAVTYSSGGGKTSKITSGAFEGRTVGGGSRSGIYGTSVYGSGYPNRPFGSSGVVGQPFPYYYYPLVWETPPTSSYPPYLNATSEYGSPSNGSRPGGVLMQATLRSNITNSTFHFLADNSTVLAVLPLIRANCSLHGNLNNATSSSVPFAYTEENSTSPHAVDAVQYYRASSAVLTLEGYNNTVVLSNVPNATALPLPASVDQTLLTCLNATIGPAIPLVDAPAKFHLSVGGYIFIVIAGLIVLFFLAFLALCITVKCCDWKDSRSEKRSFRATLVQIMALCQRRRPTERVNYHNVPNPDTQDAHPAMKQYPHTMYTLPPYDPPRTVTTGRNGTLEYHFNVERVSPAVA
ncbi:unnamed protein product [Peniophora sp. CBMAI 1063]|nr:unnamed protein product [Peniophora sp. CBMAI 1063]